MDSTTGSATGRGACCQPLFDQALSANVMRANGLGRWYTGALTYWYTPFPGNRIFGLI